MITIRRGKAEDKESIWRVHTRAITEICKSHYTEDELKAWIRVLKPSRYQKPIAEGTLYVAVDGENVVGFGNLNWKTGDIEAVYVSPDHTRRGIGLKILQTLENVAKKSGLDSLHLSSTLNALTFYQRAGYTSKQPSRHLLPFGMVACVPMLKELS